MNLNSSSLRLTLVAFTIIYNIANKIITLQTYNFQFKYPRWNLAIMSTSIWPTWQAWFLPTSIWPAWQPWLLPSCQLQICLDGNSDFWQHGKFHFANLAILISANMASSILPTWQFRFLPSRQIQFCQPGKLENCQYAGGENDPRQHSSSISPPSRSLIMIFWSIAAPSGFVNISESLSSVGT